MRALGILWALLFVGRVVGAEETFPYRATIAEEATLVRCGPGESFYPTSRLVRGAEVEVHRHDGNGWCAIRPPDGEFSLLAADRVKLLPGDDLGEVVGSEATVWVGSHVAKPETHRWQIHLQPGERAVVLGVRSAEGDAGGHWYKIAPPAGEFRWVHRDAISTVINEPQPTLNAGAAENVNKDTVTVEYVTADDVTEAANATPEQPATSECLPGPAEALSLVEEVRPVQESNLAQELNPADLSPPGEFHAAGEIRPLRDAAPDAVPMRPAEEPAAPRASPVALAAYESLAALLASDSEEGVPAETPSATNPEPSALMEADRRIEPVPRRTASRDDELMKESSPPVPAAPADFQAEASAIHLDLTLAVAKDLSQWRLGALHDRAMRLKASAATPSDNEDADALLASIARFEELYQRYRRLTDAGQRGESVLR